METRRAIVGGRAVGWRVEGSGAPVVFVHGLGGSWRWWRRVVPAFAERFEVHLVDLPRFRALSRFRPGDAADWLDRWLDGAGLERPALVGHSLGGLLAAQLAMRRPGRLSRLVLSDPAGIPTGWSLPREALALASTVWTVAPSFLPVLVADAVRWGPESLVRGALYSVGVDLRVDLGAIEVPTLVLWGERDRLVPTRLAETWRDAIPGARLELIDGAGHVPMWERPSAFAGAVLRFLEEGADEAAASG